jgi:HD-GYP domain-containing protein (c-di-GMP phosphodiesterase class II)
MEATGLRAVELLATLSLAADLGFGQPPETGLRVCLLALELGEQCGLDAAELHRVFHLALLRHIGCTASSDEIAAVSGDEIALRAEAPRLDLADRRRMVPHVLRHVGRTAPPAGRPLLLWRLLTSSAALAQAMVGICEAATTLASRLGLGSGTLADLERFYDRWDGRGLIGKAAREEVGWPALVVQVAESANAFLRAEGPEAAVAFIRGHAGTLFAQRIADRYCARHEAVEAAVAVPSAWDAVLARAPLPGPAVSPDELFTVLADFADMRSVFLSGHSRGVAQLAAAAGERLGLPRGDVELLRQAGLVHDVGRVGVSAAVWGKAAPLTHAEWEQVRLHPYYTERVLARPAWLEPLARLASLHHERCDGSGYFRGTRELSPAARVLIAADALHAMTEPRPQRPPLALDRAAAELRGEVRGGRHPASTRSTDVKDRRMWAVSPARLFEQLSSRARFVMRMS